MEQVRTLQDFTKKCIFVCQTGGNNPKVKWSLSGLESVLFSSLIFGNHKHKLTPKGVVNVFDYDTKKWLGEIRYVDNNSIIPRRFKADEELYFDDFYVEGN